MMKKYAIILVAGLLLGCSNHKTTTKGSSGVRWVGAMRNVMHKGMLSANISLDTVEKKHLYGIGPTEGLKGEIMVMDGVSYVSTVASDSRMEVAEKAAKAPFFVYAHIDRWREVALPDSVKTISEIDHFLDNMPNETGSPFFFRIAGMVDSAQVHIVNLPVGTEVKSPEDAHSGMKHYSIAMQNVEMLGVYSKNHAGVFIHHDRHTHIHLMTADKLTMGHLDAVSLSGGARLYLPD